MSEEKVFIVFRGLPHTWFGEQAFTFAEAQAAQLAEETQEDHCIMVVPKEALTGLVARYHGVVMRSLEEALKGQDND